MCDNTTTTVTTTTSRVEMDEEWNDDETLFLLDIVKDYKTDITKTDLNTPHLKQQLQQQQQQTTTTLRQEVTKEVTIAPSITIMDSNNCEDILNRPSPVITFEDPLNVEQLDFTVNLNTGESLSQDSWYGIWLPHVTDTFLNLVSDNYKLLQDKVIKKKSVWTAIASQLNSKFQTNLTSNQCNSKWRNLLRAHKKFVNNSNKTNGTASLAKPAYFNEIHELIHDGQPVINTTNICDNTLLTEPIEVSSVPLLRSITVSGDTSDRASLPSGTPGSSSQTAVREGTTPRSDVPQSVTHSEELKKETLSQGDTRHTDRPVRRGVGSHTERPITRRPDSRHHHQHHHHHQQQQQASGIKLNSASHNIQVKELLKRNAGAIEELVQVMKEKERSLQAHREKVLERQDKYLAEMKRYNDLLQSKCKRMKNSSSSSE